MKHFHIAEGRGGRKAGNGREERKEGKGKEEVREEREENCKCGSPE